MYRTIVVGSDGSPTAALAVDRAIALADGDEATLHVVHVVRPITMLSGESVDPAAISAAHEAARSEGDGVCDRAREQGERAGVRVEAHLVEGDPADMLITVAGEMKADVIVVGNRGMSGIRRFVLGSVPNKVSHHCPCDLLIVNTADRA